MDKHAEQLREYRLWARQELERCARSWSAAWTFG